MVAFTTISDTIKTNLKDFNKGEKQSLTDLEESLSNLCVSSESLVFKLSKDLSSTLSSSTTDDTNLNVSCVNDNCECVKSPISIPCIFNPYLQESIFHRLSFESCDSTKSKDTEPQNENPKSSKKVNIINNENIPIHLQKLSYVSKSILISLSKVSSGGSAASTELRALETQRRLTDSCVKDVHSALQLRSLSELASNSLKIRDYSEAARAISEYEHMCAKERALKIAGPHSKQNYERSRNMLRCFVLKMYKTASEDKNLEKLSQLTPLLGMIHLVHHGMAMYLTYSQSILSETIDDSLQNNGDIVSDKNDSTLKFVQSEDKTKIPNELVSVSGNICTKLAKIYNAAVTHLRHHLPMVAYSLGDVDCDTALVQLVHGEVEKWTTTLIKKFIVDKKLGMLQLRVDNIAKDQYANEADGSVNVGGLGIFVDNGADFFTDMKRQSNGHGLLKADDNCFVSRTNLLVDIETCVEELALLLQHTESYDRFIQHAVDEVNCARELRKERLENKHVNIFQSGLDKCNVNSHSGDKSKKDLTITKSSTEKNISLSRDRDVIPPQSQFEGIIAEIAGYYSGLERGLLFAGMRRAFDLMKSSDDGRNYLPVSLPINKSLPGGFEGNNNSSHLSRFIGRVSLQTRLVENCLYIIQRSTLRAFAIGNSGTAAALANVCADALGRVLQDGLSRRADDAITSLRPGDGLFPGSVGGVGRAALDIMSSAQKGITKAARKSSGSVGTTDDINVRESPEDIQQHILTGIARACSALNDLEVATDFTRRLETKLTQEIITSYSPRRKETEQLRLCVRLLTPVSDSLSVASKRAIDGLISILMTRLRSAVSETVGLDVSTTSAVAGSFGAAVMGGVGVATGGLSMRMNYYLDDQAYKLSQIGEGYMGRLCSLINELVYPLQLHLIPNLSDAVVVGIIADVSKFLEEAIRRCQFTALGALAFDSDIRSFIIFAKECFDSQEFSFNHSLFKACQPLSRLAQIALLVNVDNLDDVPDLITNSKKKGIWNLSVNDTKAFLKLHIKFESRKINELMKVSEDEV